MILLVDVGNTAIKFLIFDKNQFEEMLSEIHVTSEAKESIFQRVFSRLDKQVINNITSIYISNVAGKRVRQIIEQTCHNFFHIKPVFAYVSASFNGLVNAYKPAETLGIDRWLALIASVERYNLPICIVDIGTAVTIDAVDDKKNYIGGIIMPGLHLMGQSLQRNTDAITSMQDQKFQNTFALTTDQGVNSGITLAISAAVEKAINDLSTQTNKQVTCILTGGDAEKIINFLPRSTKYEPDLVLRGLYLWGKEHGLG